MSEVPKQPEDQAPKPAPEKNDAMKAWKATDIYRKAHEERDTEGQERAQELAAPTPETPEQKAGELHLNYDKKITKLGETAETKDPEVDRNTLRKSEITDIRTNARLLKVKKDGEKPEEQIANLKEETARRMRAYTQESANDWHTLDYQKMGSDTKGRSHEMHVGLGDILLDPDITSVLILQKDGAPRKATRGLTSSGRAAFLYNDSGDYAATHTGDKFRILDGTETNIKDKPSVDKYLSKLDQDDKSRTQHKKYLEENPYGEAYDSSGPVDLTSLNVEPELDPRHAKGVSEEFIIRQLGENGPDILAYAKECCTKSQIPFSIFKELVMVESKWIPTSEYKGPVNSNASGLGQFLGGTWDKFVDYCNKNNIHDPRWGAKPLTRDSRFNPYAMVYATTWLMNETKKTFPNITSLPIDQQGVLYYLAHHEGSAGAKRFVHHMNTYGRPPNGRAKGTVLALAKQIARRAAGYEGVELKTMVAANAPTENGNGSLTLKTDFNWNEIKNPNADFVRFIDVKPTNEQWILGCSTINGAQKERKNKNLTGIIGFGGGGADSMLRDLPLYWQKLEKAGVKPPKQVIISEFGLNSLLNRFVSAKGKISPEANARAEMNKYLQIADFLKKRGVKEIRFGNIHLWEDPDPKRNVAPAIMAFNRILQTEHPELVVDVASVAKSKKLHNSTDYKKMMEVYEREVA